MEINRIQQTTAIPNFGATITKTKALQEAIKYITAPANFDYRQAENFHNALSHIRQDRSLSKFRIITEKGKDRSNYFVTIISDGKKDSTKYDSSTNLVDAIYAKLKDFIGRRYGIDRLRQDGEKLARITDDCYYVKKGANVVIADSRGSKIRMPRKKMRRKLFDLFV